MVMLCTDSLASEWLLREEFGVSVSPARAVISADA